MELNDALVRQLVDAQFPQWAHLPIRQVTPGGWDNRTFRLGDGLLVRLPSADGYAASVAKEQRWLPVIAPFVPFEIPRPVALGRPTPEFGRPWSVYGWIDGVPASEAGIGDLTGFARDVAYFLTELARVDSTDGPLPERTASTAAHIRASTTTRCSGRWLGSAMRSTPKPPDGCGTPP